MEVTTKQIQELFGIKSRGTFTKWRQEQGAEIAYLGRNKWDLAEFIQWWAETIFFPKDSKGIADSRQRWEEARAQKLEFEVEKLKSEYYQVDDIKEALAELLTITKKAFMQLPRNATFPLETYVIKDQMPAVIGVLTDMTLAILTALSERATIEELRERIRAIKAGPG